MRTITFIAILVIFTLLVATLLAALSRHKKAGAGDIKLLGEIGTVETRLNPEGTVIVCGELWRAKSNDGAGIAERASVRVVGFRDHLALVEFCD
jgi:membrane-bound ClpP family serine protease